MGRYKYTKTEQSINSVLLHQKQQLDGIKTPDVSLSEQRIAESEQLLRELALGDQVVKAQLVSVKHRRPLTLIQPDWESMCIEAERVVGTDVCLEDLFTTQELQENTQLVKAMNGEYNALHRLDLVEYSICALASIIAGAVDILLVGIPEKTKDGLKAGSLPDYIRSSFERAFPKEELEKLANSAKSKVPFDAQDNRNTRIRVEGLSAYYHRLLALGHDPLLGFVVGVFDILNGTMTTVDKLGKFVTQSMDCYEGRKEATIFAAIVKEFLHLKSDITTSMGLPAPLMGLFNFMQFGSIGDEDQTVAEIVQGMYYQGYDFIHFCSLSVPTMIVEVIVRVLYWAKRSYDGHSAKESIPFTTNREKHTKLGTMLFTAHSAATAINAGKVYFKGNLMAINYPQWLAFGKYAYAQLKWVLLEKPQLRERYVMGKIYDELDVVIAEINRLYLEMDDSIITFGN